MADALRSTENFQRRYVATKEIVGYTLFDASKNIKVGYDNRFLYDVFKISLNKIALANAINSLWDILNDTFIGVFIDKTRTRWGKFRIYLLLTSFPIAFLTILRFLSPGFLSANPDDMTKFIFHLSFALLSEGFNTFRNISETGLFASISPNPDDRVRMFSEAKRFSSFIDNPPTIIMGVLMDMVNHGAIKISLRRLFATLGPFFCVISTMLSLVYFFTARERVPQKSDTPGIRQGLTAVWRNKPMRLLLLCDLLGEINIGTDQENYFIDVLGYASLSTITQIPAIPLSLTSYSWIKPARKRFENRTLWIAGKHFNSILGILVYLFGIIGGQGAQGNYNSWKIMLPVMVARDMIIKTIWGFQFVIPNEVFNETLDYCEWKDGYRAEGMILAAKGLITKIGRNGFSWVGTMVMKAIGYEIGAGFGNQSQRVKYLIFLTSIFLPSITGLISAIPKFFYPINKTMLAEMYRDLHIRRQAMVEQELEEQEFRAEF